MYIRKEKPKYWLVESHRENGKVVQKKLKYLGSTEPTPEEVERLKELYRDRLPPLKRHRRRKEDRI